jgi:hypothetical protein
MPVAKKKKKLKKVELQVDNNGNYLIKSEADALLALKKAGDLQLEMQQIALDNDLNGKNATYDSLRKGLRDFQDEKDILEFTDGKYKSLLVERTASQWIVTANDLPADFTPPEDEEGEPEEVIPLWDILQAKYPDESKFKRMWNRITKRVLDLEKLDEAVKSGKLSADEIAPAFLNYVQTKYVKVDLKK